MTDINNSWNLWYHSVKDKDWSVKSYKNVFTIRNLQDLYICISTIQINHLQNSMFFLMRDDIFPTWEDPDNRLGCCISFKIPCSNIKEEWDNILIRCISEDILKNPEDFHKFNGISFSPKKEFNILKIWLRDDIKNYTSLIKEYPPFLVSKDSLYKKNLI